MPSDINVEFRLKVGTVTPSSREGHPVFGNQPDETLFYVARVKKSELAKTIARGLLGNHPYKDLAHWVELVLEADDIQRLKEAEWSVPQSILEIFGIAHRLLRCPTACSDRAPPPGRRLSR